MSGKNMNVDFDYMESGQGILDIAIRFDTNIGPRAGYYEFIVEENGVPVSVPAHLLVGILTLMAHNSMQRVPYKED